MAFGFVLRLDARDLIEETMPELMGSSGLSKGIGPARIQIFHVRPYRAPYNQSSTEMASNTMQKFKLVDRKSRAGCN